MIGPCAYCDDIASLWGDGLCDDCHFEDERDNDDYDDAPWDGDFEDDEPVRPIEDVPTGRLL